MADAHKDVLDEAFRRHMRDRDRASLDELVVAVTPLARSICHRFLRDPNDVDDASQEVVIKLVRHAEFIRDSVSGWVCATARSTSLDILRRRQRRGRMAERLTLESTTDRGRHGGFSWEAAVQRLYRALSTIDPATRELVVQRFFQGQPLQFVAARGGYSLATAHRRVRQAITELSAVYEQLALEEAPEAEVAELLHEIGDMAALIEGLRGDVIALNAGWLRNSTPSGSHGPAADQADPLRTAGRRRVRIGVLVGHFSTTVTNPEGVHLPIERQVDFLQEVVNPRYELIGLVEPETFDHPLVERTIREYAVYGGLIDATDHEALRTLDAIIVGWNYAVLPRVLRAITDVVREGVGLYNHAQNAVWSPSPASTLVRNLLLADTYFGTYHTPGGHGVPMTATVTAAHAAFPALAPGMSLKVWGCGPLYTPTTGTTVVMHKDQLVQPEPGRDFGDAQAGPSRMPAIVAGEHGRGRIVAVNLCDIQPLQQHYPKPGDCLEGVLNWISRRTG